MTGLIAKVWSSVGKKMLMGLTGLGLVIFLLEHLLGNLLLFSSNSDPYNEYTYFFTGFGNMLILVELILLAGFLVHMISGISVAWGKRKARPEPYAVRGNAGGLSKKTISSTTMIYTGLVTLIFVAVHLKTFKYGPEYETVVDGVIMRDMYRLVAEVFHDPVYVAGYVAAMVLLGFHLRHGFWSAFQSLGIYHPRWTPLIYSLGLLIAVVLAVGFLGIPLWFYIGGGL